MIPFISLPSARIGFGMLAAVHGQRTTHVVTLLELALVIATHKAFVAGMGFDKLSAG